MPPYFRVHQFTDGRVDLYLNLGDKVDHVFSLDQAKRLLAQLEMAIDWYNSLDKGEK